MSEREARIRLSLTTGGYMGGLSQVEAKTKTLSSSLSSSFNAFGQSAVGTLGKLGSQLKGLVLTAGGLASAFTVGAALHSAVKLEEKFKDIAFAVRAGTGAAADWRQMADSARAVAKRWGQSTDDVASSFKALYEDVGNVEFTSAAMNEIAKASTASGASMTTLTKITGQLNEKFGVTKDQLPEALAAVISLGSKGGVGIDDLGEKIGLMGASAKQLGLDGTDGLSRVIGMANLADGSTGNLKKTIAGVTGLLDQMAQKDFGKTVEKQLSLKVTGKGGKVAKDAIEQIIAKTGGKHELLAKVFTGEQLKIVSDLGKVYSKAMNETTGTAKEKAQAGAKALDEALREAGKSMLKGKELTDEANKRAEDSAKKLARSQEIFFESFAKPEVTHAIDQLAANLPPLAEAAAKAVAFFVKNPVTGVGAVIVGSVTKDILAAKIGDTIKRLLSGGGAGGSGAGGAGLPPGVKPPSGGAGAVIGAAALAAAGVGMASEQANALQKLTGTKTSLMDILPGMRGGSFSAKQLLKDLTPGLGAYEAGQKTYEATAELGGKLGGKEMRRGTGHASFAARVEGHRAGPDTPSEASNAMKGAATDQKSAAQKQADAAQKMADAAAALKNAATSLGGASGAGGNNGLPPSPSSQPGFARGGY